MSISFAPGDRLAHYRLVEILEEGGMGQVWRAVDTRLERDVALKLLRPELAQDPDRLARFEREAKILGSLDHPHIVVIHSVEQARGCRFLTMELLRGRQLGALVPPGGLALDRFLELAVPLCEALDAAHRLGIVHGDLKPANIVVSDEGHLKVLDFGLAQMRPPRPSPPPAEAATISLESDAVVSGTVPYMSPEQVHGERLDPRSDVFSLGIILYEMASGRRPFRGATTTDIMASILRDTPRRLDVVRPDLPRQLARLVARCMEKDPPRRMRSVAELLQALAALRRSPARDEAESVPSLAVLPFADLSPEHDQEWFCEGLADEILSAIGRIPGVRVASRTAAFQFRNVQLDPGEIGDRLGVGHLLEGSVRKAGDHLRITARLVAASDGCQLWSRSYDRELRDVFVIQDEIAQAVVEVLEVTLGPRERRALKQVATADVHAYECYLRGRRYYYQYGRKGIDFALQMFQRAIEVDPTYALAWAGIADCRSFLYLNADHVEGNREAALEASERALQLDPELAAAHAARGLALSLCDRQAEAEAAFREALRLDPRLFEAWYHFARQSFAQGKAEQAIELYEMAAEVRPDDYQSLLLVAQIYDDLGRHDEAQEARRRGVRRAEARLEFEPDDVRALYMAANGLVVLGEKQKALEWSERALRLEPHEAMLLYNVACIRALAGELDGALDVLERALEAGMSHRNWIEHDSNLDALRGLPRFQAIVSKLDRPAAAEP
jgi:serine/threonine protein kinase/Flp pilus assembly protein TadD